MSSERFATLPTLFLAFVCELSIPNVDPVLAGDVWRVKALAMAHHMNNWRHDADKLLFFPAVLVVRRLHNLIAMSLISILMYGKIFSFQEFEVALFISDPVYRRFPTDPVLRKCPTEHWHSRRSNSWEPLL